MFTDKKLWIIKISMVGIEADISGGGAFKSPRAYLAALYLINTCGIGGGHQAMVLVYIKGGSRYQKSLKS